MANLKKVIRELIKKGFSEEDIFNEICSIKFERDKKIIEKQNPYWTKFGYCWEIYNENYIESMKKKGCYEAAKGVWVTPSF